MKNDLMKKLADNAIDGMAKVESVNDSYKQKKITAEQAMKEIQKILWES